MIETRAALPVVHASGSRSLFLSRDTLHEGREVHSNATASQRRRITHPTAASIDARHSARGAAASGASSDRPSRQQPSRHRATAQGRHRGARQREPEQHPLCTTGDLAKGLNVDRAKVAAARSHIANAAEPAKDHTPS